MHRNTCASNRAFTLIELLIVVAIIAILAAIAVPNFLEAQTRSKVSRAKADMRTLATATESYAVDYNHYPIPSDEDGGQILSSTSPKPDWPETRVSTLITTPIAYITARLNEPFSGQGSENPQFHFASVDYIEWVDAVGGRRQLSAEAEEYYEYIHELTGQEMTAVRYFMLSHGPDIDHDFSGHHHHERQAEEEGEPALYDPTNGTVSSGDILYFGPGVGFLN